MARKAKVAEITFGPEQAKQIRACIKPGSYAAVDVSQTKEKGLSACVLEVSEDRRIEISYYHQPFATPANLDHPTRIADLIRDWPQHLLDVHRILIDSPLSLAEGPGGRYIDRRANWTDGFQGYLKKEPQHAPTRSEIEEALRVAIAKKQEKRNSQVVWSPTKYTWIQVGMALDRHLKDDRGVQTGEVYPTAGFNAVHLWKRAGLDISAWIEDEPDFFYLLGARVRLEKQSLRYLHRVRAAPAGERENRFRKLSYWPYPDLWDAFGGALVCMLDAAGLSESVHSLETPSEGSIIVPMRLATINDRITQGSL